tara:strand:- start:6198 stop:7196 length:999 start_codon:yes stop_codon:yes gene_type:complete
MNSNSLIQEGKQTEEKTIMEIALYSANVGSRAHEVAQYEIKSTDSWKTRVQNNFTQFRTLENVLPKTLGNNISKYDILCHQEVAMPKGTSHGIEDNYFNHFGDFDFVSKETGYVWMIRPATLGHHPKPEKVFHGTTVGWNRNKFKKVGTELGTGYVGKRSTSWIILESRDVKGVRIVVSSVHLPVDNGKSKKNEDMWKEICSDIVNLRNKGYRWIFVAGDFNKNYANNIKQKSFNLVDTSNLYTNVNVSYYDETYHPSESKVNCYKKSTQTTYDTIDFQFVSGNKVSVTSCFVHQIFSPIEWGLLLPFNLQNEMIRDYDHIPISSTFIIDLT